ncbi:MAG: polyketide cyclase [Verrucomicrobia bacterium]|nr:polyketide cyclase [Verrucomicrobiota bacterium]
MHTNTHAEAAAGFLRMVALGEVRAAYDKFVGDHFRHHNPYFQSDRQSLLLAMQQSAEREPNKSFVVQRIVASGDHVVVHSRLTRQDGSEYAVVHICRFEHGKIVELWDLAQAVPGDSPNELGMF